MERMLRSSTARTRLEQVTAKYAFPKTSSNSIIRLFEEIVPLEMLDSMSTLQTGYLERRTTRAGKERTFIAGTRIGVQFLYVEHELMGRSPDEIVAAYPHLTLAQVHAALSYCYDHLDEMRREYQEDLAFVEEHRRKQGPGPLAKKLRSDGDGDSLSS